MKSFISEFVRRGLVAFGFGPLVLAVVYLILQGAGVIDTIGVNEVCIGIFSLAVLAFMVGGMNAIYQIERLPLMVAILIHGGVLYVSYLCTYLLNDWLDLGMIPIIVFTAIFVVGYIVIWTVIYLMTKRKTAKLNRVLDQKRQYEQ